VEQARESGFFSHGGQGDLFGPPPRQSYAPKPEKVREKLLLMLEQMRSEECPWSEKELGLNKVIFPQMTNWLPAEEAARLRFEFAAELERLENRLMG
jgi:hypothetical protein